MTNVKITLDQFIERGNVIHKNKYDYSLVNYIDNKTNVSIICPVHGQYLQQARYHLKGCNCPKCSVFESKGKKKVRKVKECKSSLFKLTLEEAIYNQGTPNNKYNRVRSSARQAFAELLKEPCKICGYEHHVELCHIKSISSFNGNTLLSEINSESNLIILCPNCHWELDHGLLTL